MIMAALEGCGWVAKGDGNAHARCVHRLQRQSVRDLLLLARVDVASGSSRIAKVDRDRHPRCVESDVWKVISLGEADG
jgi:hypothetical protein